MRNRVGRHPDCNGVHAGAGQERHRAIRRPGHNQRQGARPEPCCKFHGGLIEHAKPQGIFDRRNMDDQRIELRSLLGRIDSGNRLVIGRITAEPVDGLGRKRHQLAVAQQLSGLVDILADQCQGYLLA